MERKHSEFWKQVISVKNDQPKVNKYLHTTKEWKRGSHIAVKYENILARFVIKNHLSLSIVECEWLQKLCLPGYILPGLTYFTKTTLQNIYIDTERKIKYILKNVNYVGVQLDHYTSS